MLRYLILFCCVMLNVFFIRLDKSIVIAVKSSTMFLYNFKRILTKTTEL